MDSQTLRSAGESCGPEFGRHIKGLPSVERPSGNTPIFAFPSAVAMEGGMGGDLTGSRCGWAAEGLGGRWRGLCEGGSGSGVGPTRPCARTVYRRSVRLNGIFHRQIYSGPARFNGIFHRQSFVVVCHTEAVRTAHNHWPCTLHHIVEREPMVEPEAKTGFCSLVITPQEINDRLSSVHNIDTNLVMIIPSNLE